MSKRWERFFYILSYLMQGASYMSPRAYAIMHRMHHAYTDTEKDPHSPKYSSGIVNMMLRTNRIYMGIYNSTLQVDEKFTKNIPDWPKFDRWGLSWMSSIVWVLIYIEYYILFASAWWMYLFIPVHILMGPIHGTIVNWFAHKYGYINFKVNNTSRNLLPIDFLMLGELYHNNHHKYPVRINFGGIRWHEFDPVYPIIRLLGWMGIIKIVNLTKKTLND